MDALTYPWESYLPKRQQWHRASQSKPYDPEARFMYVNPEATPLSILESFKSLQGVWVERAADADLESLRQFPQLKVVRLREPRIASLAPLRHLPNLHALHLEEPPVLHGLDRLQNVRCLVMRHFRQIKSLSAMAGLTRLCAVSLSTIPNWDAAGRCLEVESLEPFRQAATLESLALMGVWPLDGRLDALHSLTRLKFLHISHVYRFRLEEYAALRRLLPNAVGHCLEPYFTLPQLDVRCKRCDAQLVFLTGPRPRTPRRLCPNCHAPRLRQHVQRWNAAVQGTAGVKN
jgi:hypothetical protein